MERKKFIERPNRLVRKPAKKYKQHRRKQSEASSVTPGSGTRRLLSPFPSPFSSRPPRITRQMSEAITDGNFDKVRQILDNSAHIEDFEEFLDILHQACATENISTVAVLLRHGACVNALGRTDRTPLHIAVKLRNLAITSLLISYGASTNIGTKFEKRTALHIAAGLPSSVNNGCSSSEMIRLLCDHGARVNQGDIYGTTPLHIAARQGHTEAVTALLDHRADIDKYDNDGWTALHVVSVSGNEEVARLLIDRNANINCQNKYGRTPLHWACSKGHVGVVQLLLEGRADPNILDHHGRAAMDHAADFEQVKSLVLQWIERKQSKPVSRVSLKINIDTRITRELCTTAYVEKENLLGFFSKHKPRSQDLGSEVFQLNGKTTRGRNVIQLNSESSSVPDSVFNSEKCLDAMSNDSAAYDSGRGPSEATVSLFPLCSKKCALKSSEFRENYKRRVATLPINVALGRDVCHNESNDFDKSFARESKSLNGTCTLPNRRGKIRISDDVMGVSGLNISDRAFDKRTLNTRNCVEANSKLCCQIATADETFQSRTLYIDKMLSRILHESQRALKDDNPTMLSEGLQNTHKEMQSLQNFMHDFRSQMSSQFNTLERVVSRDNMRVGTND